MKPVCPYCFRPAKLVSGAQLWPSILRLARQNFWRCDDCDAHVGCHRRGAVVTTSAGRVVSDGTLPLGRLADKELRKLKVEAHNLLDTFWARSNANSEARLTRREAYYRLSVELGIPYYDCHIGYFDADTCRRAIAALKTWSRK